MCLDIFTGQWDYTEILSILYQSPGISDTNGFNETKAPFSIFSQILDLQMEEVCRHAFYLSLGCLFEMAPQ